MFCGGGPIWAPMLKCVCFALLCVGAACDVRVFVVSGVAGFLVCKWVVFLLGLGVCDVVLLVCFRSLCSDAVA